MSVSDDILADLTGRFTNVSVSAFRGQTRASVAASDLLDVLRYLRDDAGFDALTDITCVDYLHYRGAVSRFGLVYVLGQTETGCRIVVRVMLDEPYLSVQSAVPLWEGANWMEREVWDMFGVRFEGHPDLRRILLPEEFTAHPLRKDYPLQGLGERHNFPTITRGEA